MAAELRESPVRATFAKNCRSVRPLLPGAVVAWLSYLALVLLLFSPAMRVYDAGSLPYLEGLRTVVDVLLPNALVGAEPDSQATVSAVFLYLALTVVLLGSWCWAMRRSRGLTVDSPLPIIALTAMMAAPLLIAPGLMSDDLYLYNLYGRAITVYGANPVLTPPAAFAMDPHLPWVYWQDQPSAYGPIWLMLSAGLSALAADSVTAVVIVYRFAGLALHLAIVAMLWRLLRHERQSVILPAVLFYAWNPLVLLEVVANAHNDVLVALFAVALVGAGMQQRWSRAAIYGACAVMVKPFALVLVPSVARQLWQDAAPKARTRTLALTVALGAAVVLALNLPLWSGAALIRNAMHNPAAREYTNTLWEVAVIQGPGWLVAHDLQHPYLDAVRAIAFLIGVAWVLTRRASGPQVPQVAMQLWLLFCLTACWVWPWYFVPALALAPLAGAAYLPAAAGITIGGLLFWAGWPQHSVAPLPFLYEWRSLLLFGPLFLGLVWAPARSLIRLAPRVTKRWPAPERARLQKAPG